MITKILEVRDRATFVPVVAVQMRGHDVAGIEQWYLGRCGYGYDYPHRLSRLQGLLRVTEKDGENCLPNIITNNELRMALEPLMRVYGGVKEITEMLLPIYHDTKRKEAKGDNDER